MEFFYWFIAGAVTAGALLYLVLRGPSRGWWQWALIVLFAAWCVVSLGATVATYGEGNAAGGNIMLLLSAGVAVVLFVGLRFALRAGTKRAGARA